MYQYIIDGIYSPRCNILTLHGL